MRTDTVKLLQAKSAARIIALNAADFLNRKNTGTPFQDHHLVLAMIQGTAERLIFILETG
jgi:hypothetical protein